MFKAYAKQLGIKIRLLPPGLHSKTTIESNYRVVHSIYLRLKEAVRDTHDASLSSYKTVSVSNNLYVNDTISAFELSKGFRKPIIAKPKENVLHAEVIAAHNKLQARRKLSLILNPNALQEQHLNVRDFVEVYSKKQHEKRRTFTGAKQILCVDYTTQLGAVTGKNQRMRTVPIEDLRPATPQDSLVQLFQELIESLDLLLEYLNHNTGLSEGGSNDISVEDVNEVLTINDYAFSTY